MSLLTPLSYKYLKSKRYHICICLKLNITITGKIDLKNNRKIPLLKSNYGSKTI